MKTKPPYEITTPILKYIQEISEKLGEIKSLNLEKPPTKLRRDNRIKSIYSSLAIEGNTLSIDQVSLILDEKTIVGPLNDIIEVQNAINVYNLLPELRSTNKNDLLKAHKLLMFRLIKHAGKFRKSSVGIVKGSKVEHLAPPAHLVPGQINNLFNYLNHSDEITLIKSCVFHYEFEFIHPFADGNGRMGRIWQTKILMEEYPVFEFIPIEHVILNTQKDYYKALSDSDKLGKSTPYIEFMLNSINNSINNILSITNIQDSFNSRIDKSKVELATREFNRLDYMKINKNISPATASRDLRKAVDQNILIKRGTKRTTIYKFK